jgi:hypothetical protein
MGSLGAEEVEPLRSDNGGSAPSAQPCRSRHQAGRPRARRRLMAHPGAAPAPHHPGGGAPLGPPPPGSRAPTPPPPPRDRDQAQRPRSRRARCQFGDGSTRNAPGPLAGTQPTLALEGFQPVNLHRISRIGASLTALHTATTPRLMEAHDFDALRGTPDCERRDRSGLRVNGRSHLSMTPSPSREVSSTARRGTSSSLRLRAPAPFAIGAGQALERESPTTTGRRRAFPARDRCYSPSATSSR